MKTISEINRDDYLSFFLTEETESFQLKINTPNGLIDATDYDLISSNAGILIGYKSNLSGVHNQIYSINGVQKRIQILTYDGYKPIINREQIGTFDIYSFVNSVAIPTNGTFEATTDNGSDFIRCDYDKFGGLPFYPNGAAYGIIQVKNVLDVSGSAHVLLFNTTNNDFFTNTSQVRNCSAKTLTGILKNIYEWSLMAQAPFNSTEQTAIKALQMWNELNIPNDLLQWLLNNQVDMQVARFLKGETRLAYHIDENTDIPNELINYIKNNSRYRTLTQIKAEHPRGALIEDTLLEEEKIFFEKKIFEYCINNDIEDMSITNLDLHFNSLTGDKVNIDAKYYYEIYKTVL